MITVKLLCVMLGTFLNVQSNPPHLIVWYTDNTKVAYELSEHPQMNFNQDTLYLRSDRIEVVSLSSVKKILYADIDSINHLAIQDVVANQYVEYKIMNNNIIVQPVTHNAHVLIVSVDGKVFYNKVVPSGSIENIQISAYPKGIYLVRINNIVHKMVKL